MTDATNSPKPVAPVSAANDALEARVAELEAVVHVLATAVSGHGHASVLAWLGKVGARIKAAAGKVL